jgi:hypothetical protein
MGGAVRPNRVQKAVCREAITEVLGDTVADAVLRETGIAGLLDMLPAGPRDLEALTEELQPFVDLYRAVLARADRETALRVARRAIVESGVTSHAHDAVAQRQSSGGRPAMHQPIEPEPADAGGKGLQLTSPPPPGFQATQEELTRQFDVAMSFFSCQGHLLAYTPEYVRFHITGCNWVRAMQAAGAPELIPFFCETDERFMDHHPTHRLVRPTAIGLGDDHCDFEYVPRSAGKTTRQGG